MVNEVVLHCPVCNSIRYTLRKRIAVEELIKGWKDRFGIDIRDEMKGESIIRLLECRGCGLLYYSRNGIEGSAALYGALEKNNWYYMPRKWEHDVAIPDLYTCQKVLEVGCGEGDFIARLQAAGFDAEGIELNESAVQKSQARGLAVHHINLVDLAVKLPGHYDAVCTFQVLEHVQNPYEFLSASCALIKQGGRLLIGVPNADSYLRFQYNLLNMPPHHLTCWSALALRNIPARFPLRLIHLRREPLADYHVNDYVEVTLHRYARIFNRQPMRIFSAWLIRRTGFRKYLTGHTLYAAYERR